MLSTNPINEDTPSDCSSTAKRTLIEQCIQVSKGREMEDESYPSGAFSDTGSYAACRHGALRNFARIAYLQVPVYLLSSKNASASEGPPGSIVHDHVDKSHGQDLSGSA